MDLEKLAARLRPRQQVEAMDLGVGMVRAFFGPVILPWLVVVVPVATGLFWLQPGFWGLVLVWWLLPFFDRVVLFVLSRGLFGDVPSLARTLREVPRLMLRFWFLPLTFGRLSPFRCFHLPVSELELQRGKRYADRCRVLRIDQDRGVLGLYAMSGVVVICLWVGALAGIINAFTLFYHPSESAWFSFLAADEPSAPPWIFAIGVASILIVEPFHVASGFALYLNRRLHLEGWDIELTFRRLARRINVMRAGMRSAVLVLCGGLTVGALPAGAPAGALTASALPASALPAQEFVPAPSAQERGTAPPAQERGTAPSAQERGTAPPPGEQEPQKVIEKVLAHEDFGSERTVSRWRRLTSGPQFTGGPLISGFGFIAELMRITMWVVFIGGALWIVWLPIKVIDKAGGDADLTERGPPPAEVMGLDVRPESLPDDPAAAAWQLWQAGDAAGCLSLLYRAALASLIHRHELAIGRSATEVDCLELVRPAQLPKLFRYFAGLTAVWQTCAYGHRLPAEDTARRLCREWPSHFGGVA